MSGSEDFRGGKRVERAEIERRVREIVARNQEVLQRMPENAGQDAYWGTLHREGVPATLTVRRLDGSGIQEQYDMYFIDADIGAVEMTYFISETEVGESFWVAFDRIEALG